MSSSGFESIIEGLLDPKLLEDLKQFKGKIFFFILWQVCDQTTSKCNKYLFVVTIVLYCAIWYPPTFTPIAAEKKLFL